MAFRRSWHGIALALVLAALPGCVDVRYQRPGQHIAPRAGKTLVFGRLRFFHDGREFFPWKVTLVAAPAGTIATYAGDLTMKTESHEGGYVSYSEFGTKSVEMQPIELARTTLEQKFGTLRGCHDGR
jgi:hypothetical protein